jgi:hypothetical protein
VNSAFFKLILLFPLLCFACTKTSHWSHDCIHSQNKEHHSSRLCYFSKDPIHGIDLELLNTKEHLKVYLNVHSAPIPPCQGNAKSVLVKLKIDDEQFSFIAHRLEGGQRILLPKENAEQLIEALKNHREVTLVLNDYRTVIKTEDFLAKFDHLEHPRLENPIHFQLF